MLDSKSATVQKWSEPETDGDEQKWVPAIHQTLTMEMQSKKTAMNLESQGRPAGVKGAGKALKPTLKICSIMKSRGDIGLWRVPL